jgi:hypothetical protein
MFGPLRALGDKRSSDRDARPAIWVGAKPEAARYLTDGTNLYRVVDALRGSRGHAVVGVEDCRSLELILLPADELRALRLRPVRPAAAS